VHLDFEFVDKKYTLNIKKTYHSIDKRIFYKKNYIFIFQFLKFGHLRRKMSNSREL
jgi:hypothetical protein